MNKTDANGIITAYVYDDNGNILIIAVGGQHTQTNTYDLLGNLLTSIDGNGAVTTFAYNSLGMLRFTILAMDSTIGTYSEMYRYTKLGQLASSTASTGKQVIITYDNQGRVLSQKEQKSDGTQAITASTRYDKAGNPRYVVDGNGATTEFTYDILNRKATAVITVTDINNVTAACTTTYAYDANGNVTSETDWRGNVYAYAYDALNRLTQVKNALNETTSYTYDVNGNVLTQTDGAGNVTTVQYNVRNLPVAQIEPGGGGSATTSYTYNPDGSVATMTDPNGVVTTFTYDIHGRALSKSAGGKSVSYTYDANGNVLSQTDGSGTTTRTYDALGCTTSKNVPGIGTTTYLYDITAGVPAGHLGQTTTDPKGNSVTKVYDKAGRLVQVKSGSDTTTYAYFANGNRQSMSMPGGITATYTYYADNRLHTLANMRGGSYISTFNYAYDGNGNMLTKLEQAGTTSFVYDALGRLREVTEPDGKVTDYTYDASGNRLTETVTGSDNSVTTTDYTYNAQSRLTSAVETSDDGVKTTNFAYDNNGNQISKLVETVGDPSGGGGMGFTTPGSGAGDEITYELDGYDAFNQLISVENDNYTASYTYNADGLRIGKTVTKDGQATASRYMYEGGYVTLELDGGGNPVAYDVYGGDCVLTRKTSAGTDYYAYNGHGDVVQLTDSAGWVTVEYDYDAFGNLKVEYLNDSNPWRYCCEYWDEETRTYYLRARYYSPKTGRFTQRDSYAGRRNDPLSLNRYTYGHNNPVKYRDPSGHVVTQWDLDNCTPAQITAIQQATDDWNNATTDAQRAAAHMAAYAARVGNLGAGQYVSDEGYTHNSNGSYAPGGNVDVYLGSKGPPAPPGPGDANADAKETGGDFGDTETEDDTPGRYLPVDVTINGVTLTTVVRAIDIDANLPYYMPPYVSFQEIAALLKSLGISVREADYLRYIVNGMINLGDFLAVSGLDDYFSWWRDNDGIHYMINTALKSAPVQVVRRGNEFFITAYIEFGGDSEKKVSGMTYADAVVAGIMKYWNVKDLQSTRWDFPGQFTSLEAISVTTKVIVKDPQNVPAAQNVLAGQQYVKFTIYDHSSISNNFAGYYQDWSINPMRENKSSKVVAMYRGYAGTTAANAYSLSDYMAVAAHEFGHVLGIGDAYGDDDRGREPAQVSSEVPEYDLMRRYENAKVTANDVEMMWEAFTTGQWQYFTNWPKQGGTQSSVIRSY